MCLRSGAFKCIVLQRHSMASYLQRLPLLVQQVRYVLCHLLHQVPGVVLLHLELGPLVIVDLQRRNTPTVQS